MYRLIHCPKCRAWHGFQVPARRTRCRTCDRTFLTDVMRVFAEVATPGELQQEIARRKRAEAERAQAGAARMQARLPLAN